MARFHVHALRARPALVLDCQADLLDYLETRLVVPLLPPAQVPAPVARLHPLLEVDGRPLLMATHLAASVPTRALGDMVADLTSQEDAIAAALDMLLIGY